MKNIICNNFKKKILANKYFYTVLLLSFIILLFLMKNVVMYADDFALKIISNQGWSAIFENQINHYLTWGGGFTPLLVTVFLRCPFFCWKVVIALLVWLIIYMSAKMLPAKSDKQRAFCSLIILNCLLFATIKINRETMFWLDGSMAYVFTTFQIFLYIYYLITRIFYKKIKKRDYILFPIIAFLAGWSSAQTGAIALIIPTLIILYAKFIKHIKIKKFYHIVNILGIIGFCIFFFAPGNSSRMSVMGEFAELGIFEKINYRISNIFTFMFDFKSVDFNSIPFFLLLFFGLISIYGIYILKIEKNKKNICLKISLFILIMYMLNCLCIMLDFPGIEYLSKYTLNFINIYAEGFSLQALIQYGLHFLVILASLITSYFIAKKEKNDSLIILPIIMSFSQGVMVMAPYSEYRTEWIALVFLAIIISYLFIILFQKKCKLLYLASIPFLMYNIYIGILLIVFTLYNSKTEFNIKHEYVALACLFSFLALINTLEIHEKYYENRLIYEKNIQILEQANKDDKIIYLEKPKYDYYGFGGLLDVDYVESSLKILYNLNEEVDFQPIEEGV